MSTQEGSTVTGSASSSSGSVSAGKSTQGPSGPSNPSTTSATAAEKPSGLKSSLGILYAALSGFGFGAGNLILKEIKAQGHKHCDTECDELPASVAALYRYTGILFIAIPLLMDRNDNWFGPPVWSVRMWLVFRALFGVTGLWFAFLAVHMLTLANATIIDLATPIFVFLFAYIFLREQFGRYHAIALVLSMTGIMITALLDTSTKKDVDSLGVNSTLYNFTTPAGPMNVSEAPTHSSSERENKPLGYIFQLTSTVLVALAAICIRKMSDVHYSVIMFDLSVIGIIELGIIILTQDKFQLPTEGYSPYLVVALAVTACYAQVLFTQAAQMEEAGVVSIVRYGSATMFAFFNDAVFYGKISVISVLGAILVFSAVVLITFRKYILSLQPDHSLRKRFNFLTY